MQPKNRKRPQGNAQTDLLFVHEATPRPRDTSRSVTYSSVALKDLLQYYYTPPNLVCQYEEVIFSDLFPIFFQKQPFLAKVDNQNSMFLSVFLHKFMEISEKKRYNYNDNKNLKRKV